MKRDWFSYWGEQAPPELEVHRNGFVLGQGSYSEAERRKVGTSWGEEDGVAHSDGAGKPKAWLRDSSESRWLGGKDWEGKWWEIQLWSWS